jgi:hypothetical protein
MRPPNYERSEYRKRARIINTTYYDSSRFYFTKFFNDADFRESKFKDESKFRRSEFWSNAYFANTYFEDADFTRSIFKSDADFSESKFNEADFEGSKFLESLNLNKAKYEKMYIRINDINKLVFNETTYKSLIDNFKKIGFIEDANDCYYRFMIEYGYEKLPGLNQIPKLNDKINTMRININDISTDPIERFLMSFYFLFSWILYGFGTKPLYTLIWSLILIFIFGLFWWNVQRKSKEKKDDEYSWDNYHHKSSIKSYINYRFYEIINAIILSGSIFLSGTKFFIDPPDIPDALEKATPWVSRIFKLERFFGGALSILFLISIGSVIFSI